NNNHILNTLLMRFFTLAFGTSHLTVRAPALIGAGIYIVACYRLCRLFTESAALRWAILVCLVYNPFVFDYLVAARGYGLAMAFLMAALVAWIGWELSECADHRSIESACAISSLCVGPSFAADFSFEFVDFAAVVTIFL